VRNYKSLAKTPIKEKVWVWLRTGFCVDIARPRQKSCFESLCLYCNILRLKEKAKVKLSVCLTKRHAVKTSWSGGIAPCILDFGTRWRWVVSLTLRPLYRRGRSPPYQLDRRLGGLQSRSGCGGEDKTSQPPQGIDPYNPDLTSWLVDADVNCGQTGPNSVLHTAA
jgi:hypothetical protein